MPRLWNLLMIVMVLAPPLIGQTRRLWVLRESGEMVEHDTSTFAARQNVKLPPEALKTPVNIQVNGQGQILFVPSVSLPLSDEDIAAEHKIWFWNGHAATTFDQGVIHKSEERGSNQAVSELAPVVYLSADGNHLFWFANEQRRLEREQIDLSTATTWQAWHTDLSGGGREDLASMKLPDCRCSTGACEESCPLGVVWAPERGIDKFFLLTQFVAGQTTPVYKASTRYQKTGGSWTGQELPKPLQRVLDASADGSVIVEAIPDTGCCGWSNQSNDQTLALVNGKTVTVFDERETYKNPDYDVSFYTSNAKLSPDSTEIAMTIVSTVAPGKPIQQAEQGEANPEESQRIRKALTELPAVSLKTIADSPKQVSLIPHATLVGWISDKELLIVEDHLLTTYNVASGARKKSSIRVEDPTRVFLR